ncbi:MAG: class I SAM-dependent methyltransferase, partial [Eggerthellales bacterium]|nr:class I SAM-dependent methyltransferase [Eggerthellales bacterium]
MTNPWTTISLLDYEGHMALDSVMQLQTLNRIMASQIQDCPEGSVMVMGVAGGNSLEYANADHITKVVGLDINQEYLDQIAQRKVLPPEKLTLLQADLTDQTTQLPHTDSVIANLLIEYIGYDHFVRALDNTEASFVSCAIQVNLDENWVSNSPYLHAFDCLDEVHHLIDAAGLTSAMTKAGFTSKKRESYPLPNGK